jgi:glycosyltransferase involved in cell wall biosynthesis
MIRYKSSRQLSISGGVNGLLVTPKDVNALTGAMEFLLQDPAEVDRMAKNARP